MCLTDRKEKTQYISFPILEKAVKYIESIKEFLPFYDAATTEKLTPAVGYEFTMFFSIILPLKLTETSFPFS